jgi:trigger factor
MNVSARSTGAWQHTLDIDVPIEEVEQKLDEVSHQVQRRASLPGFRRGRVPLEMVRQHFADRVEQEFIETFVPRLAGEAIDQERLNPVVTPLVRNLRFGPGQPLTFEVVVDVKPEVEAKNYRGLKARRTVKPVDDAAVGAVLEDLREQSAVFADLDRPSQRGDVVLLDSTRLDANGRRLSSTRAKARRIQLGAPDLLPDLENGLLGAVSGQERTIDVTYPADYPGGDLAGKQARYVVKIRKIQEKKLRDLDDNLAQDVFGLGSLEELRSRVRLNLEGEERVRMQREMDDMIANELLQRNTVELPGRWVEWMLERVIADAVGSQEVPEALRAELEPRYRPGVERSLMRSVLLDAVARQEQLEASDEEVAEEIARMAQSEPRQAARVRARYQTAERREALRDSLRERKALDWLINAAEIQEETAGAAPLVVPAGR